MKKLLSLVVAMIIAATTFAQVDEVTLTVLGTGRTEDEATNIALRSAIEQSFGTFVSANTTILNDRLVRDEIVSVSKGNIKNYDKLAVSSLPNGQIGVSIRATVSINKLISYAKSKGSRAEFAGQTYAANVKLIKLKAESTKKAIDIMLSQMEILTNDLFDFELILGEPYVGTIYTDPVYKKYGTYYKTKSQNYIFPCKINVYANIASTNFANIYYNTLKSLNLSDEEIRLCQNNKIGISNVINLSCFKKDIWGRTVSDCLFSNQRSSYYQTDEIAAGIIIPLSASDNVEFHGRILDMCIKALRRYEIQEIGTKNVYKWEKKYIPSWNYHDVMEDEDNNACKDIVCVGDARGLEKTGCYIFLLWSNEKNEFLLMTGWNSKGIDASVYGHSFQIGINNFIVPIRREPINLTREQKRAQKNGTFAGKTYKEIVGKQEKLLTLNINLYKTDIDQFKGYELKGVSAPQNK